MRNLIDVIDQMLSVLPTNEESLRKDLFGRKDSCFYTAPEAMSYRWEEVANILVNRFGKTEPISGWQKKIVDIWMDRK